jgi:hypothetical protein
VVDILQLFVDRNERYSKQKKPTESINFNEDLEQILQKLETKELERDISNMKPLIFDLILDNLLKIEPQNVINTKKYIFKQPIKLLKYTKSNK